MSTRAKKAGIKDEEWERLQPVIRELYLFEDRSQKDLMTILSVSHGFRPSKSQLEQKLRQWHMVKNMTSSEWKYVNHRIRNRHAAGKESSVYLSGVQLRDATIAKAKARHCYETALEKSMGVVVPPSPTDLSLIIRTPSPQRLPELDNMHGIPWFTARSLIKDFNFPVPGRVKHHLQLPGDELLMLATERPLVQADHTARLVSTFEALSLIMPEELQQDHVSHAESILLSSKHGINIEGALQVMLFLLSNNFLDRQYPYREEHDKVIEVLLDVLPQTDGWAALMSQQYAELPVSIQSALDRLWKEAILRSDLELVQSLTQMGVDANQVVNGSLFRFGVWRSASAFEYAVFMNNWPLIQLLIKLEANHPSSNLDLILATWKYRDSLHTTFESMAFLLSNIIFCQENDKELSYRLLEEIASVKACPIAEQIFEFFRIRLHTPASKSQLLASAIRARSKIVPKLLSEGREHVSAYINPRNGPTPIMAAIDVGDINIMVCLLQLGASLDSSPSRYASCSPLQYAAYVSDADMLRGMLEHGAEINYCDLLGSRIFGPAQNHNITRRLDFTYVGETALQSALLGGKIENAIFLLEAGASLVGSELAVAIAFRQDAVVSELVTRGASFADTSTLPDTLSVLEAAVLAKNTALISRIINQSSQAVVASSLWAAIFVATSTSDLSIFRLLLNHISVTPQSENVWLGTAMYLAAILRILEIVELMLASGLRPERHLMRGYASESRFLERDNLRISDYYLRWRREVLSHRPGESEEFGLLQSSLDLSAARGIDWFILLQQYDEYRQPHLHLFSVGSLGVEDLQVLQSFGVEMTLRMLSESIRDKRYDVTDWLLTSGVDVNRTRGDHSDDCDSPVQMAAYQGNLHLVERLKDLGADINAPAVYEGATALQYASMRGFFGLVRRLLEFQADPNAPPCPGYFGRTALEGAAENGKLDVVQLLLNSGVETVGSGRLHYVRAIRFARERGHHAVARLIKSHRPWEEADQILFDDKKLLDNDDTDDSDDGTDEETDEEYEIPSGTSDLGLETLGAACEVTEENIEVDEKGHDSNTGFGEDEELPEYPNPVSDDTEEWLAYGLDEKGDLPGDAIWAEAFEAFSSEQPWLMTEDLNRTQ